MEMTYNQAATIYRINLGWRRSRRLKGFLLDVNSGYWRNDNENLGLDENEEVAEKPKESFLMLKTGKIFY